MVAMTDGDVGERKMYCSYLVPALEIAKRAVNWEDGEQPARETWGACTART